MTSPTAAYDVNTYILVIDDDETLLKFFKIHLNKFFSRIVVVKNAKDAVTALTEKQIDLVISDIRMPRVDGIQLMKKVRNHDPSIPVFLVSGAMLDEAQMESVDNKADGFLRKPFTIDELHDFVANGLRVREIYKEIYTFVPDKKKFLAVVKDDVPKLRQIKNETDRKRVEALLGELNNLKTHAPAA